MKGWKVKLGFNDLPKDPWSGVKTSKAADRWESEIGWKMEAAKAGEEINAATISTRNLPRFLAIPAVELN